MIFIGYIDIILSILADIMPFFVVLNSLTDVIIKVCSVKHLRTKPKVIADQWY